VTIAASGSSRHAALSASSCWREWPVCRSRWISPASIAIATDCRANELTVFISQSGTTIDTLWRAAGSDGAKGSKYLAICASSNTPLSRDADATILNPLRRASCSAQSVDVVPDWEIKNGEFVGRDNRVAIAILAGEIHLDRQTGHSLQHELADNARMRWNRWRQIVTFENCRISFPGKGKIREGHVFRNQSMELSITIRKNFRLIVNLLQHEMGKSVFSAR